MASVLSERKGRPWMAGLQSILFTCQAYIGRRRRSVELDQRQPVAEVADDLCATLEIWSVDSGLQTRAHIACWHRQIEAYRGYLLCSNTAGQTFLIDLRTYTYVKGSVTQLLQIDGVDQAKRFVDTLCCRLQVDQESHFN